MSDPWERDVELLHLNIPDAGRERNVGEPGFRSEEPRDDRDDAWGALCDGLRRRTTLEMQARQPEREVELRAADASAVPVDQGGVAICAEAQIVAAHIEMTQGVSLEQRWVRGIEQRGKRVVEPLLGAQA